MFHGHLKNSDFSNFNIKSFTGLHSIMLVSILLLMMFSKTFSLQYSDSSGTVQKLDEICGRPTIEPLIDKQNRIINGAEARQHSWPWQVSLQRTGGNGIPQHICGGTLIAPNKILTAAHCLMHGTVETQYKVQVGKHDMSRVESLERSYDVKKFSVFKGFNQKKNKFPDDIIVIQLTEYLEFNENVKSICLAQSPVPPKDALCFVTGWGKNISSEDVISDVLRQAGMHIQTDSECQEQKFPKMSYNATKMLCALDLDSEKDSCQGDSGGPLVCLQNGVWYQYGIVSFGIGCAEKNRPGVYTRVSNYYNWVQQQLYIN